MSWKVRECWMDREKINEKGKGLTGENAMERYLWIENISMG